MSGRRWAAGKVRKGQRKSGQGCDSKCGACMLSVGRSEQDRGERERDGRGKSESLERERMNCVWKYLLG
jgi:hypothetical protein